MIQVMTIAKTLHLLPVAANISCNVIWVAPSGIGNGGLGSAMLMPAPLCVENKDHLVTWSARPPCFPQLNSAAVLIPR